MSDLTDRIAAVLREHVLGYNGEFMCVGAGCDWTGHDLDHPDHVAAVVVDELGLLSKEHSTVGWQGDRPIGLVRYVTDWEPT